MLFLVCLSKLKTVCKTQIYVKNKLMVDVALKFIKDRNQMDDVEIDGQVYNNVSILNARDFDTAYSFQTLGFNRGAVRFTESAYELYPGN